MKIQSKIFEYDFFWFEGKYCIYKKGDCFEGQYIVFFDVFFFSDKLFFVYYIDLIM